MVRLMSLMLQLELPEIMLGNCPAGKLVVKAAIIPATIPAVIVGEKSFFIKIIMNNMINITSGFIPAP